MRTVTTVRRDGDWSYQGHDSRGSPLAAARGRPGTSDPDIPRLRWHFRLPGCSRHKLDPRITSTEHDFAFDDVGNDPATSRIIVDPMLPMSAQTAKTRVTELVNGADRVRSFSA